jgi:hypothetical protein
MCELLHNLTKTFHRIPGVIDHNDCTKQRGGGGGGRAYIKKKARSRIPCHKFYSSLQPGRNKLTVYNFLHMLTHFQK